MPKLVLNRDIVVAGEHKKAGAIVDVPKGDAAYLVGHKAAVLHRDITKVAPASLLPPLKAAETNDDEDTSKKGENK